MKALFLQTERHPLLGNTPKQLLKIGNNTVLGKLLNDVDAAPDIPDSIVITSEETDRIIKYWITRRRGPKIITTLNKSLKYGKDNKGYNADLLRAIVDIDFDDDLLIIPSVYCLSFPLNCFIDAFKSVGTSIIMSPNSAEASSFSCIEVLKVDSEGLAHSISDAAHPTDTQVGVLPCCILKRTDISLIRQCFESGAADIDSIGNFARYLINNSTLHIYSAPGQISIIDSLDSFSASSFGEDSSSEFKLREEQKSVLDSFKIERLDSTDGQMLEKIRLFTCSRNPRIEAYLKGSGIKDNLDGDLAVFLILNEHGDLVMVFSLCCGMLFKPEDYDADQSYVLSQYQKGKITHEEFIVETEGWDPSKWVVSDTRTCDNPEAVYADKAMPAIELVHICNNDAASSYWMSLGIPSKMGVTLFWHLIVPFVLELNQKVGFDYLYLYAADNRSLEDGGNLISHYNSAFAFNENTALGIIKPRYNEQCTFMVQSIKELCVNREIFWDFYNR